ncbi:MAG TPA: hypothetical protein VGX92_07030 [Pyrinomonadaceae bacterium]|jgi:hypothetical protein|nr:hypothetical protein [Pyrinomonadaceae bacterium]
MAARDTETTERLRALFARILSLTTTGKLEWERRLGSAHRYSSWNNNLLILGPDVPPRDKTTPRYLLITPFDSPDCIEVNSNDEELGDTVRALVKAVDAATAGKTPRDPFAITEGLLKRLKG